MPPELKRQRRRTSNWWEVAPVNNEPIPPQQEPAQRNLSKKDATKVPPARNQTQRAKDAQATSSADKDEEQVTEKPKRRGRSSNAAADVETEAATTQSSSQTQPKQKKKVGRSKKVEVAEEAEPAKERPGRKSARQSGSQPEFQVEQLQAKGKGARKKGEKSSVEEAVPAEDVPSEKQQDGRKKGRQREGEEEGGLASSAPAPNRKRGGRQEKEDVPESSAPEPPRRKRGRPSNTESELQAAAPIAEPEHRGRVAKQRSKTAGDEVTASKQGNHLKRKRNVTEGTEPVVEKAYQQSRANSKPGKSKQIGVSTARTARRAKSAPEKRKADVNASDGQPKSKRQRLNDAAENDRGAHSEPEPEPSYQHLATVTRRVSRQTIESKWEPLPTACVERISQLFQGLQRPAVMHLTDERQKIQAGTAIDMISRRLIRQVAKGIPFPQSTRNHREDDFDFEKILDSNRLLAAQLTPALHSIELLESELNIQEELLEAEEDRLAELETNAKAESTKFKQDGRKQHLLVPKDTTSLLAGVFSDDIGLEGGAYHISKPTFLNIQKDEDLAGIIKDMTGHIDSMQSNMGQIEGVTQAMIKSKAAVQATLFKHLDSKQYEDIVLG